MWLSRQCKPFSSIHDVFALLHGLQEYMAGGTLKQLVTREMLGNGRRTYTGVDALDICLQMARGLRSVMEPVLPPH